MACHTPPLKKMKKQGELPLPRLCPVHPKFYIVLVGWDRGWVIAFALVSSLFEGWSMTGHPLILREIFLLVVPIVAT